MLEALASRPGHQGEGAYSAYPVSTDRLPPEDEYRPSDEDLQALTAVEDFYQPHTTHKAYLERQWQEALAFVMGYHYHDWDSRSWSFVPRQRKRRREVREWRNFIRPYAERQVANLAAFRPQFKVRPSSTDTLDQEAARTAEKVLQFYWRDLDMDDEIQEFLYWAVCTGTSFFKVYWDAQAGKSFTAPKIVEDENGEPELTDEEDLYFEGDVAIDTVNPFHIFMDPMASKWSDVFEICQVTKRPLSWFDRAFPDMGAHVQPDLDEGGTSYGQESSLNLVGPGGYFGGESDSSAEKWATCKEFWTRPTPKYPRGRYIVTAGNVVLRNGENPTPGHELPFVMYRDMIVPGQLWGQSNIDNHIPVQRNYNRITSQKVEHVLKLVHTKLAWHAQSGKLPTSSYTAKVGEVLKWSGQQAPAYLTPPPLPNDINDVLIQSKNDMDEIGQTYGVDKGQFQGKMSGVMGNLLVEQHEKYREPKVRRMGKALERVGGLVLRCVQANADEERLVKVHGERDAFEVFSFQGADLEGSTDVEIDLDSIRPKSRELAYQRMQLMTNAGLLNPESPEDKAIAWRMVEQQTDDSAISDKAMHERQARRKAEAILKHGQPVLPHQAYEDVDIHSQEYTRVFNSDLYRRAPPERQQVFQALVMTTLEMAMPQPGITLPDEMMNQVNQPEPRGSDGGKAKAKAGK